MEFVKDRFGKETERLKIEKPSGKDVERFMEDVARLTPTGVELHKGVFTHEAFFKDGKRTFHATRRTFTKDSSMALREDWQEVAVRQWIIPPDEVGEKAYFFDIVYFHDNWVFSEEITRDFKFFEGVRMSKEELEELREANELGPNFFAEPDFFVKPALEVPVDGRVADFLRDRHLYLERVRDRVDVLRSRDDPNGGCLSPRELAQLSEDLAKIAA